MSSLKLVSTITIKMTPEIKESASNSANINQCLELGNNAGKIGNIEESVKWYTQGLILAQKNKDTESIRKFSGLIALSL